MAIYKRYYELIPGYLRGDLDQDQLTEFNQFLESDSVFRELVLSLKSAGDLEELTEWSSVNSAAHDLLDRMLKDTTKKSDCEILRGVMTYDSAMLPGPEGIRPAGISTRRIKYTFGDMTMVLSLYPVCLKAFEIIGRISGLKSESGLDVTLSGARKSFTVAANEHRIFRFKNVPIQSYKLKIVTGGSLLGEAELRI